LIFNLFQFLICKLILKNLLLTLGSRTFFFNIKIFSWLYLILFLWIIFIVLKYILFSKTFYFWFTRIIILLIVFSLICIHTRVIKKKQKQKKTKKTLFLFSTYLIYDMIKIFILVHVGILTPYYKFFFSFHLYGSFLLVSYKLC
jgi:hypothetical protein